MDKIIHTPQVNNYPVKEVFIFRELIETKEFNEDFRQKVESAHKRKKEYDAKNQVSFGGIDKSHLKYIEEVFYLLKLLDKTNSKENIS